MLPWLQGIMDCLMGRQPLPWEDPDTKEEKLAMLRMLRKSLTKCLSRNPSERPTAGDLLDSWNKLFDNFAGDKTMA